MGIQLGEGLEGYCESCEFSWVGALSTTRRMKRVRDWRDIWWKIIETVGLAVGAQLGEKFRFPVNATVVMHQTAELLSGFVP